MKLHTITSIILCCVFMSCANQFFTTNSAYKRIKHPGVSSGKSFVEYTIEFNNDTEFTIDKVSLDNKENFDFLLFSVSKKNYVKPKNKQEIGQYILTFKIDDIKKIANEDIVLLVLNINGKLKTQKIPILKKKAFRSR